jgi:hypothetical protein
VFKDADNTLSYALQGCAGENLLYSVVDYRSLVRSVKVRDVVINPLRVAKISKRASIFVREWPHMSLSRK